MSLVSEESDAQDDDSDEKEDVNGLENGKDGNEEGNGSESLSSDNDETGDEDDNKVAEEEEVMGSDADEEDFIVKESGKIIMEMVDTWNKAFTCNASRSFQMQQYLANLFCFHLRIESVVLLNCILLYPDPFSIHYDRVLDDQYVDRLSQPSNWTKSDSKVQLTFVY